MISQNDPDIQLHVRTRFCVVPIDENKALWGISLMKKAKKTSSPKAFGIRLEDCQPAVNHKVSETTLEDTK